jgi:hypothetical protein
MTDVAEINVCSWLQWQLAVVALLHEDLAEMLGTLALEEVDWSAWRCFYEEEGRTPRAGVDRALERDF